MVVAERCLAIIITAGAGPTTLVRRKQNQNHTSCWQNNERNTYLKN